MNKINIDIYLNIWSFIGPKSIYIMPKNERKEIHTMKKKFTTNPIRLYYKLVRWKSVANSHPFRASIRVDKKEKFILLDGDKKININKKDEIKIFYDIEQIIIPRRQIVSSTIPGRIYQLIWKLYNCRIENKNMERAKIYSIFWNNY